MIGSGLVHHLNDLNQTDLLLVDHIENTDKWKNLVGKKFSDIIGPHQLFELLKNQSQEIQAIIHLGACSDTMETNGDYLLENNYRFTIRLADFALNAGIRFIYASSAATYGDGSLGFSDDEAMLESLRPINMYAFSKHLVDLWMKKQNVLDKVASLKYFNVFGPNEYHKGRMSSMVLKMNHLVKKEGVIRLYKSNHPKYLDGDQCRDFIYLKDAVRMTAAFLENDIGGIFNIGLGIPTTWNDLARSLFDALELKGKIDYIDMPDSLLNQYQNYTCAKMDKFNRLFQIPKTPIQDAVKEYVQEYLIKDARW